MLPDTLPQEYRDNIATLTNALLSTSNSNLIQKIYLFGSCARGIIHHHSDIDLAVILSEEPTIDLRLNIRVDAVTKLDADKAPVFEYDLKFGTENSLAQPTEYSVFSRIKREGVIIYDTSKHLATE